MVRASNRRLVIPGRNLHAVPARDRVARFLSWYSRPTVLGGIPGASVVVLTIAIVIALVVAGILTGTGLAQASPSAENTDDEIVYLDSSGTIRVLDLTQSADEPEVQWFSPSGGWTDFALGDVNADGDTEIIAVGIDGSLGKLAVFDPVVPESESDTSRVIGGIPWDTLYETVLPGAPRLVQSGEFDTAAPGVEIIFNYVLPTTERTNDDWLRFVVLKGGDGQTDGRTWETMATHDTGNDWTWISTGDVDGIGVDEVALVDENRGNLNIYRVTTDQGLVRFFRNASSNNAWRNVEIGQFIIGAPAEVVAVREADYPLSNVFALRYVDSDSFADAFFAHNNPNPRFVFLADIGGNGDDEMVILRKVRPELGNVPRLFVYDYGDNNADSIVLRESALDPDNGYLTGTGGDVDGDGRDEFILIRDTLVKVFTEPEQSSASEEIPVSANADLVRAGNLDANGLGSVLRFAVSPISIADSLDVDKTSGEHPIRLTDNAAGTSPPFTWRIENGSNWVSVTANASNTPATLATVFDADGLAPGLYTDRLLIESSDERVAAQPYSVDLSLTVKTGIAPEPSSLSYVVHPPCDGDPVATEVSIAGTSGVIVTTAAQPPKPWLEIRPLTGTIPVSVTVTVNPSQRVQDFDQSDLVLEVQRVNGSTVREQVPIVLLCAEHQLHLPNITRQ